MKFYPSLFLLIFIVLNASAQLKPSGNYTEYRRESSLGYCFNEDASRISYNLNLDFKPKEQVEISIDGMNQKLYTYTIQDSVLTLSSTENIIFSKDVDFIKYTGYVKDSSLKVYTCYFIKSTTYKKYTDAKRETLSYPNNTDMKYKADILKKKKLQKEISENQKVVKVDTINIDSTSKSPK